MSELDENDNKLKIDTLFRLADQAWRSFDANRSYEWKMSLALWTALAAFGALLLRHDVGVPLPTGIIKGLATAVIIVIPVLYWMSWTVGGWSLNYFDVENAYKDWNKIRTLIGEPKWDPPLRGRAPKNRIFYDILLVWTNWARVFQMLVTFLLSFVAVIAVWNY